MRVELARSWVQRKDGTSPTKSLQLPSAAHADCSDESEEGKVALMHAKPTDAAVEAISAGKVEAILGWAAGEAAVLLSWRRAAIWRTVG